MKDTIKTRSAYNITSKKSSRVYYLHSKDVMLAGNRKQRIYYFAGTVGEDALDAIPEGFEVFENQRTGLPMLRRIRVEKGN